MVVAVEADTVVNHIHWVNASTTPTGALTHRTVCVIFLCAVFSINLIIEAYTKAKRVNC